MPNVTEPITTSQVGGHVVTLASVEGGTALAQSVSSIDGRVGDLEQEGVGSTGPAGMSGLPGPEGLGIRPDWRFQSVATAGGAAVATLCAITPSAAATVLPDGSEITVGVCVKVHETAALAVRGSWEFDVELARIGGSFSPAGVVNVTNAKNKLPAGFAVELTIDAALGILVRGSPAANAAYWTIESWIRTPNALATTGGTAPGVAAANPTVAIGTPDDGFAWITGETNRVVGTYASANARVTGIEVLTGAAHLAYASLGAGDTWAADVVSPAGAIALIARATTVAGGTGDSTTINGLGGNPDTEAPVVDTFTVAGTSASFEVPAASWHATDNLSATIYCLITGSSTPPTPFTSGWHATTPNPYVAAVNGTYQLYPWAMDLSGNVSAVFATPRTVVVDVAADTIAPTVTAFTLPATASSRTITISSLTGTDDVGITGWAVTEDTATVPSLPAFGTLPATITASADGAHVYRVYARDLAGHISGPLSANCTVDADAPVTTAFVVPQTSTSLTVPVSSWTATDVVGVTNWIVVTDSAVVPGLGDAAWTTSAWTQIVVGTEGPHTFYAYERDAAGHISVVASDACTVTLPDTQVPVVTAFTIPSTYGSLTVPVSTLTATDNVTNPVTLFAYVIDSATPPLIGAFGASPANIVFTTEGAHTVYMYAADAAGNISLAVTDTITVSLIPAALQGLHADIITNLGGTPERWRVTYTTLPVSALADFTATPGCLLSSDGSMLSTSGGTSDCRGFRWNVALQNATIRVRRRITSGTNASIMILSHLASNYAGTFIPNPALGLASLWVGSGRASVVNGVESVNDAAGGTDINVWRRDIVAVSATQIVGSWDLNGNTVTYAHTSATSGYPGVVSYQHTYDLAGDGATVPALEFEGELV